MLRLLLDEHISRTVANRLRRRCPGIAIFSLDVWERGRYLACDDETLLSIADRQNLTLVTYDWATIEPLLKTWGEQGKAHAGVIFVDNRTLAANDFGGLVLALEQLWKAQGSLDWTNRAIFLTRRAY